TALLSPPQATALAVRYASKKTGGSSKNLGGKSPGKRFGIKRMEDHHIDENGLNPCEESILEPWGGPPDCPADQVCVLQVGLGKKKYLYALEEGIVHYTKEVYVPSPSNSEAVDLVTRLPEGAVLYKTFVHVVPAKPEGTFKLVAML
ncbi:hypothetical protein E2I00_015625, partial [Balaenoptera physalus]